MLIEQLSSVGITEHRLYYLTEYPVRGAHYRRPIKNCGLSLLSICFTPSDYTASPQTASLTLPSPTHTLCSGSRSSAAAEGSGAVLHLHASRQTYYDPLAVFVRTLLP
jgi:hypothetical protein